MVVGFTIPARGKAKLCSAAAKPVDEVGKLSRTTVKEDEPAADASPLRSSSTSVHKSPFKGKQSLFFMFQ